MSNAADNVSIRLVLSGRVALEVAGRPVPIRRKGLALLAYLALEGPTPRDMVADLLWRTPRGRDNLRVELSRLGAAIGRRLQDRGADPLTLPGWIAVRGRASAGGFLAGLEGVSPGFDEWLDGERERRLVEAGRLDAAGTWVDRLAERVVPPAVVLLRARPAADARATAQALASALRLQLADGGSRPGQPAVRLLQPPFDDARARAAAHDAEAVWVVPLPAYGEEPLCVLELRSLVPPEKLLEVEVPPLTWQQAREGALAEMAFDRAAAIYLQAGGDAGYIDDLARSGPGVLPRRVHAAYLWEARHASLGARLALERLAVHPGVLPESVIDAFGARRQLDELERRGWLNYADGWHFTDPVARHVVHLGLQPGRKRQWHGVAAEALDRSGDGLGSVYHRRAAGMRAPWAGPAAGLHPWARRVLELMLGPRGDTDRGTVRPSRRHAGTTRPDAGSEVALLEDGRHGKHVRGEGAIWRIVRRGDETGGSGVVFEVPPEPLLLHLDGHAVAWSPLWIGLDGRAAPLAVRVDGRLAAVLAPGLERPEAAGGVSLHPLGEPLDAWLALPAGSRLRLESQARAAVIEVELAAYRAA